MITMKWRHLLILTLIMIGFGVVLFFILKLNSSNEKAINAILERLDSYKNIADSSRIVYNNSRVESKFVVEKWNMIHDSIVKTPLDSANCNKKLVECSLDIRKLDTALINCDTLIANQYRVIKAQDTTIVLLRAKKASPFGIFGGIGVGVNHKGQFSPTALVGLGIKIK